jgi:hypothetical protein
MRNIGATKKTKTAFEWGARSAIQKAIRRSDGQLLVQAAKELWRLEPSWLFWRMPVLAAEEVPQLLGDTQDVINEAKVLKKTDSERAFQCVLNFLHRLCSYKKDKTAWALTAYAWNCELLGFHKPAALNGMQDRQWRASMKAYAMMKSGHAYELWASLLKKADGKSVQIRRLVNCAHARSLAGGMEFDQHLMAIASIVAMTEYGDDCLNAVVDEPVSLLPARVGDWPWVCYDMHTLIGKRALSYVSKKYGLDTHGFKDKWFFYESNLVVRGGDSIGFWFSAYRAAFEAHYKTSAHWWAHCNERVDLATLLPRFFSEEPHAKRNNSLQWGIL